MRFYLLLNLLLTMGAMLLTAGCATTATAGGPESESDRAISDQVRAALSSGTGYRFPDVNVRTHDGRVELRGSVPRQELSDLAEEITRDVAGVHSVINIISVRDTARSISPTPGQGRGWDSGSDQGY